MNSFWNRRYPSSLTNAVTMAVKRGSSTNSSAEDMLLCITFQEPVAAAGETSVIGAATNKRHDLRLVFLRGGNVTCAFLA